MTKLIPFLLALLIFTPTMVRAIGGDAEELSYEDLVDELARSNTRLRKRTVSPFDDVKIHAGFGMVNSFSTFELRGRKVPRYQNGLQLSIGVDLFSPLWFAEASWRNFGLTRAGTEEHTLRELGLKFGYRNHLEDVWSYRLQGGLADRHLRLSDSIDGLSVSDTTPALLGSAGISLQMAPAASLNFDASVRSPVVGRTADKGSWDFAIDFKVSM